MRYMLLIYDREQDDPPPPEQQQAATAAHWAVVDETNKLGVFRGAEPLQPTNTATTLRMQGGKLVIMDGPFAETKEQLAGYYILDCPDEHQAIALANKIVAATASIFATAVGFAALAVSEIRPIRELPARPQPSASNRYADSVVG